MNVFAKAEIASALTGVINSGTLVFALSDAVSISIITSTAAVIMAGLSAWFSHKAKISADKSHDMVNSRMEEFKKLFEQTFVAQGVEQERKEEAQRKASVAQGVLAEKERTHTLPLPPTL